MCKISHILFLAITLLLLAATALRAEEIKCNPDGNQMELNQCAWDDYQKADKKLNDTWKKLMAKFKTDKTATAKLKAAQKAWIAFRDAEVEAMFACEPNEVPCWGSMEPMLRNGELQSMTEERTKRLQHYIDEGLGVSLGN